MAIPRRRDCPGNGQGPSGTVPAPGRSSAYSPLKPSLPPSVLPGSLRHKFPPSLRAILGSAVQPALFARLGIGRRGEAESQLVLVRLFAHRRGDDLRHFIFAVSKQVCENVRCTLGVSDDRLS